MRILVTGKGGQLGRELCRSFTGCGEVIAIGTEDVDFIDKEKLRKVVLRIRPELIVNAASYTSVDEAEREPHVAKAVNGEAVSTLVKVAEELNAAIIHFSTDYVFSGWARTAYKEISPTQPINAYGKSKLSGEKAVLESSTTHLVFRTSWVYGLHGRNFFKTIFRLAKERECLRIVDDQISSPTSAASLADITAEILKRGGGNWKRYMNDRKGLYHLTSSGKTSWCGFARTIVKNLLKRGYQLKVISPAGVQAIRSNEFPTLARRPAFSVLDNSKFIEAFGIRPISWEKQLDLTMEKLSNHHRNECHKKDRKSA